MLQKFEDRSLHPQELSTTLTKVSYHWPGFVFTPAVVPRPCNISVRGVSREKVDRSWCSPREWRWQLSASSDDHRPSEIPNAVNPEEIRAKIHSMKERHRDAILGQGAERNESHGPRQVAWVLVFNGRQRDCGLYCLWSSGRNDVLAFENRDEALRYALELKAQGFRMPGPNRVMFKDLNLFCTNHGFGLKVVPRGMAAVAPDQSKPTLEYDPVDHLPSAQGGGRGAGSREEPSHLTEDDIRRWRAGLERLYRRR
ncbi:unnamed protein product [Discosporangium mesarthrocarpum]